MLLKSVSLAFQAVVDTEEELIGPYFRVNQARFDPETIPARKRYLNRRVKLVQTLLRWRKHFGKGPGIEGLVKRVVDVVIIPVAEGGWEVGGEECLRKVRPGTLLGSGLLFSKLTRSAHSDHGYDASGACHADFTLKTGPLIHYSESH